MCWRLWENEAMQTPKIPRTLGLIGGMSWESTAAYYRLINQGMRDRMGKLRKQLVSWRRRGQKGYYCARTQCIWSPTAFGQRLMFLFFILPTAPDGRFPKAA